MVSMAACDFGGCVHSKCALTLILGHFPCLSVTIQTSFTEKNDIRLLGQRIELDLKIRFQALKKDERYIFWTNGHSDGRTAQPLFTHALTHTETTPFLDERYIFWTNGHSDGRTGRGPLAPRVSVECECEAIWSFFTPLPLPTPIMAAGAACECGV